MLHINKKIYIPLLFLIGYFSLSCSNNIVTGNPNDKISVATSIFPIYSIANQIAKDKITVNLLIQPGDSPHTFTPTISTKQSINSAKRIYIVDQYFDASVVNIIDDKSKLFEVSQNIELKRYNESHSINHEGNFEPHYWLDPKNAIEISRNITRDYIEIDPKNKITYEHNLQKFTNDINKLYIELQQQSSIIQNQGFATMHDAWGYFNDAFNLNLIASFEPTGAESPTPKYLNALRKKIKEKKVIALFSEPQLSLNSIAQFLEDQNLKTEILDPLGGIKGRMSYQELLKFNIDILVKTLK